MDEIKKYILERQEYLTPLVRTAENPMTRWKIRGMLELIKDLLAEIKRLEKSQNGRD